MNIAKSVLTELRRLKLERKEIKDVKKRSRVDTVVAK